MDCKMVIQTFFLALAYLLHMLEVMCPCLTMIVPPQQQLHAYRTYSYNTFHEFGEHDNYDQ